LWQGSVAAQQNSGGSGNLLADLISAAINQVVNQSSDHAHAVSRLANEQFAVQGHGLLYGPYHPKYGNQ
jgi:hypothetical protein